METNKKKLKVIGIKGLQKFFNCSRITLYNRYLSRLVRVPSVDNRALYTYESALRVKQEDENKKNEFEEVL